MPLYVFECACGHRSEIFLEIEKRNTTQKCEKCRKIMGRVIGAPAIHSEPYQMKAILGSGEKISGHFGKEAPRRRKK